MMELIIIARSSRTLQGRVGAMHSNCSGLLSYYSISGPRSKAFGFGEYQLAVFDQLVRVKLLRPLLY